MKTVNQLLSESLDKPYTLKNVSWDIQWKDEAKKKVMSGGSAEFTTDEGYRYNVFSVHKGITKKEKEMVKLSPVPLLQGGIWEIHFTLIGAPNSDQQLNVTDIAGTGDAFRVFATVKKYAEMIIDKERPSEIHIKSKTKESNRTKLYAKLAKRYASKLGYKFKGTKLDGDRINFTYTREK